MAAPLKKTHASDQLIDILRGLLNWLQTLADALLGFISEHETRLTDLERRLRALEQATPAGEQTSLCGVIAPVGDWRCTRTRGHRGLHRATIGPADEGTAYELARWE
jgi:hypothetical protein